jgi:hypothetical protein
MLNPYDYRAFRGSSDFDSRHNINANVLYELPLGKGKMFLSNTNKYVGQMVGGWQISNIMRYRSGLPTAVFTSGIFPTNFSFGAIDFVAKPFKSSVGYDNLGNPGLFSNVNASQSFLPMYAGDVGTRAPLRLAKLLNFDIAVSKAFQMPWEGQRVQFRAEAFNAFNNVNFINPTLDTASPANFGEFQNAMPSRVMQFALRYEF